MALRHQAKNEPGIIVLKIKFLHFHRP